LGKRCTDITKYYWTHRAYDHSGNDCFFWAKDHKVEATFNNKLGRSKVYCNWWYELRLDIVIYKINGILRNNLVDSPNPSKVIAKGDSGAMHNYWQQEDKHCLIYLEEAPSYNIILPNALNISPSI